MHFQQSTGSRRMLPSIILCAVIIFSVINSCQKTSSGNASTVNGRSTSLNATVSDPTSGWTQASYTYSIQTPWNLPQSDRYSFSNGEHHFWIQQGDACQFEGCTTGPRSELRMNNDYTTGRHQFEGDVYIVSGTDGTDIMQVFGGVTNATSLLLKVTSASNGTLKRYDDETLMTNVYNTWVHVNVQHDADNGLIYIYINNVLKGTFADRGVANHYFKCGVYNITGTKSETHWKNVTNWINGPVGQ
jgi:hypothetical protein